ncbi:hypothetical protein FRC00_002514 [Tulasnella sp. 408]|nr:hypothetical protein FRC00_002514 [Tulasnella sp. 408]
MPGLKEADREARLPLYLQRLLKQLQDPLPDEQDPAYYELCILCHASQDQNEPWLTEEFLSIEKFKLFENLKSRGRDFVWEPCFKKNPYETIPDYVKSALLPPIPWRSALKTAAPPQQDGATLGSTTQLSTTANRSFTAQSGHTGASKRPGGTTTRFPDNVRRLRKIERLDMEAFGVKVAAYVTSLPMGFQSLREKNGSEYIVKGNMGKEHLSIPAFSFRTVTELSQIGAPEDEFGVQAWVGRLAGTTSSTLLHLCDSSTKNYAFSEVVGKNSKGEKSDLSWQQPMDNESGTPSRPLRRLVIEVKTPWTLDPVTFQKFVEEDRNIWAQIYDYCVTQGNYFFVLTSYEFWVFGVFSADYTFAQVTKPIPYDSKKPTILAVLMYWTQSAMLVPGLHEIPWRNTILANEDATIAVLIDNVHLHQSRMSILTGGKANDNPRMTARRFMKNLGTPLNEVEQKFSKLWDQFEVRRTVGLAKTEPQEQQVPSGADDVNLTMHRIGRDLMLQDPLPPTASEGIQKTEVKEEPADLNYVPIPHGSVTPSHGFKIPPSKPRHSIHPHPQSGRGSSQSSFIEEMSQALRKTPNQLMGPPASLIADQAAFTPSNPTLLQAEPAQDFRRRTSEPNLRQPSHDNHRSSSTLKIKSDVPTSSGLEEHPSTSQSRAAPYPAIRPRMASSRNRNDNSARDLPPTSISAAEHLDLSTINPLTAFQKDRLIHPSLSSAPPADVNSINEVHRHPLFVPPAPHINGPPVYEFTLPPHDQNPAQYISSFPTRDRTQDAINFTPDFRAVDEIPWAPSENPNTPAYPLDSFAFGLLPSPARNPHVSQGLSQSGPSTPGSGFSIPTPGTGTIGLGLSHQIAGFSSSSFDPPRSMASQGEGLGLDVGGYSVDEPRKSTSSKSKPKRSCENVSTGDNRVPKKRLRQE